MALDLQKLDTLDWVEDDGDLAFVLNDALASGDSAYLDGALDLIERAKRLPTDFPPGSVERLFRAADAIEHKVIARSVEKEELQAA